MSFARSRWPWVAFSLLLGVLSGCGGPSRGVPQAAETDFFSAAGVAGMPVTVRYQTRSQLSQLAKAGVDFEGFDLKNKRFRSKLTSDQFALAKRLGLKVVQDARPRHRNADPEYRTYERLASTLRGLAAKRPELAQVVDIGDSWEKQQGRANRDILALRVGKPAAGKPVVLFAGCHHARELVTSEMVLLMAQRLIDGYGQDAEVTGMVDTREIWLVPMVNPDGHALAIQGEDQRKNTNNLTGGKINIGVDLNRNYGGPDWNGAGTSTNPNADNFGGKAAFSEPEVQAMRDLMRRIKPTYLLSFHAYSNLVLWPWGYTDENPPDARLPLVGTRLGQISGYEAGQSGPTLYPTAGDDTDWAFAELGTLAYTIEVGDWNDGFDPPYSAVPRLWKPNLRMMSMILRTADEPARAAGPEVTGGKGPKPVAAEFFVGVPGSPGRGRGFSPGKLPVLDEGDRTLLWSHARDSRGNWGPWSVSWSRPSARR